MWCIAAKMQTTLYSWTNAAGGISEISDSHMGHVAHMCGTQCGTHVWHTMWNTCVAHNVEHMCHMWHIVAHTVEHNVAHNVEHNVAHMTLADTKEQTLATVSQFSQVGCHHVGTTINSASEEYCHNWVCDPGLLVICALLGTWIPWF